MNFSSEDLSKETWSQRKDSFLLSNLRRLWIRFQYVIETQENTYTLFHFLSPTDIAHSKESNWSSANDAIKKSFLQHIKYINTNHI